MKTQDLRTLKIGEFIEIGEEVYEVIQVRADAIPAPNNDPPIRQYHSIFLHNVKSEEILPQSELMVFDDNNEIWFNESKVVSGMEIVKKNR